jgi:hypothetical protein
VALCSLLASPAFGAISRSAEGTYTNCGPSVNTCEIDNSTISNDDLNVAIVGLSNDDNTLDLNETGWTDHYTDSDGGSDKALLVSYKIASSEPANLTADHSGTAQDYSAQAHTFTGVDTTTPLDGVTPTVGTPTVDSTTFDPAAVTTNTDNAWVCSAIAIHGYNGTSPTGPSGYTVYTSPSNGSGDLRIGLACKLVATAGSEDPGTWGSLGTFSDTVGITFAIREESVISFTSGPTITAVANGYNIAGTLTGSGTLTTYALAVNPAAAAPTCTQLQAGDDGSNVDAPLPATAPGSEVWTSGVANDFDITLTGAWPRHDVHVCGSDGTNDTAVTSSNNLNRSEDTSEDIDVLSAAIASTSFLVQQTATSCDSDGSTAVLTNCSNTDWIVPGMSVGLSGGFADLTDIIVEEVTTTTITLEQDSNSVDTNVTVTEQDNLNPDVATNDVCESDEQNSESNTMAIETDGDLACTSCSPNYWTWDFNCQDVSDASDGDFTSLPSWTTGDETIYVNSTRPENGAFEPGTSITITDPIVLDYNVALSGASFPCTDVDLQTVTVTSRETPPTGTSIATNGNFTGTPTVEDEAGSALTIDCADSGDLYATATPYTIYVVDTWTMTNIVGKTVSQALTDILVDAPWRTELTIAVSGECSKTVNSGIIISQSPAASTEQAADVAISAVVSVGTKPCARRGRDRFR